MTPKDQVLSELDRLRRLAAASHVFYPHAEATRAEVEQFVRAAGAPVGPDLVEFWLAGEGFVIMAPAPSPRPFEVTPSASAKRTWFGYEREVHMQFGPQKGRW